MLTPDDWHEVTMKQICEDGAEELHEGKYADWQDAWNRTPNGADMLYFLWLRNTHFSQPWPSQMTALVTDITNYVLDHDYKDSEEWLNPDGVFEFYEADEVVREFLSPSEIAEIADLIREYIPEVPL